MLRGCLCLISYMTNLVPINYPGLEKFEKMLRGCLCLFDNRLRSDDELIAPPQLETVEKKVRPVAYQAKPRYLYWGQCKACRLGIPVLVAMYRKACCLGISIYVYR